MSTREELEKRRAEIEAELHRPKELANQLAQVDAELRELDTQTATRIKYIFKGVMRRGSAIPRTVVVMPNGKFLELPNLMFEHTVGEEKSQMTRAEFDEAEKQGRVLYGGRQNEVTEEMANRLKKAGYPVERRELPPERTHRSHRSATV